MSWLGQFGISIFIFAVSLNNIINLVSNKEG